MIRPGRGPSQAGDISYHGRTMASLNDGSLLCRPIGTIRSSIEDWRDAPKQGAEGAPDAWIDIEPGFAVGLRGIDVGDTLVIITWLHLAERDVLEVHPRGDPDNPLTGVFATRSPHRPNPLGLHRVTVTEIAGNSLRVEPIEAINQTPVVDIKVALDLI